MIFTYRLCDCIRTVEPLRLPSVCLSCAPLQTLHRHPSLLEKQLNDLLVHNEARRIDSPI